VLTGWLPDPTGGRSKPAAPAAPAPAAFWPGWCPTAGCGPGASVRQLEHTAGTHLASFLGACMVGYALSCVPACTAAICSAGVPTCTEQQQQQQQKWWHHQHSSSHWESAEWQCCVAEVLCGLPWPLRGMLLPCLANNQCLQDRHQMHGCCHTDVYVCCNVSLGAADAGLFGRV
jgi:hypothetical protein